MSCTSTLISGYFLLNPSSVDFSADAANPGCVVTNAPSGGQVVMNWTFVPGNRVKCTLLPNTDYWFNVKMHDPTSTVDCAATNPMCPLELALTFGHT